MTGEKFVDAHFAYRGHAVELDELLRAFIQRNIG